MRDFIGESGTNFFKISVRSQAPSPFDFVRPSRRRSSSQESHRRRPAAASKATSARVARRCLPSHCRRVPSSRLAIHAVAASSSKSDRRAASRVTGGARVARRRLPRYMPTTRLAIRDAAAAAATREQRWRFAGDSFFILAACRDPLPPRVDRKALIHQAIITLASTADCTAAAARRVFCVALLSLSSLTSGRCTLSHRTRPQSPRISLQLDFVGRSFYNNRSALGLGKAASSADRREQQAHRLARPRARARTASMRCISAGASAGERGYDRRKGSRSVGTWSCAWLGGACHSRC